MIDSAKIKVKAGNGGDGVVSFINVFYNPRGGPDGGNGGNGGDVYIVSNPRVKTLSEFLSKKFISAEDGINGSKNYKYGKNGSDAFIEVPVGTVVKQINTEGEEVFLEDLNTPNKKVLVAKGGKGGVGNAHFKSSTNQNPKQFTRGKVGEEKALSLELKLLSNVGLIGFPSVGKSTLLNSLANTNAKTASYHFTTLSPNLGVLHLDKEKSLVISDLPGLIEGASKGKGLGEEFLKHAERCGVLIHILDPTQTKAFYTYSASGELQKKALIKDLLSSYGAIRNELKQWSKNLLNKPEYIVVNKIDITEINNIKDYLQSNLSKELGENVFFISAYSKTGLNTLVKELLKNYNRIIKESEKQLYKKEESEDFVEINLNNIPNKRIKYRLETEIEEKLD